MNLLPLPASASSGGYAIWSGLGSARTGLLLPRLSVGLSPAAWQLTLPSGSRSHRRFTQPRRPWKQLRGSRRRSMISLPGNLWWPLIEGSTIGNFFWLRKLRKNLNHECSHHREGNSMEDQKPPNRLDAALDRLEEVVRSRIDQPLRHLREVIAYRRERGAFNEERIAEEVEKIAFRDRQAQT